MTANAESAAEGGAAQGDTSLRPGTLWLVATPIGNLGDVSQRAHDQLASCDWVASEDTRHTGRLLKHLGLDKRQISLHEHNEAQRIAGLLGLLQRGDDIALVSDAGTPLICDPGFRLVRAVTDAGLPVGTVPGPTAFVAAVVLSGLPTTPLTFLGFPPPKSGRRRRLFESVADLGHTIVFYESPHRIARSLRDALQVFGDRRAALSRELTKLHEETIRGTLGDLDALDDSRASWKGEFVVCIAPQSYTEKLGRKSTT